MTRTVSTSAPPGKKSPIPKTPIGLKVPLFWMPRATPRTTVGGQTVRTQLPLTNPNSQFGTANLPTYYFRTHVAFPANADPAATMVSMRAMFDDGIVVYVNGTEVYHSPLITNGVNDAFASYLGGTVGDAALTAPITLNASSFVDGDNVVAVYLKQGNNGSSDSTMGIGN